MPRKKTTPKTVPEEPTKVSTIPEWLTILPNHYFEDDLPFSQAELPEGFSVADDALDTGKLVIQVPSDGFSAATLANLLALVNSKASLLKKALGAEELPVARSEDRICFPWFPLCSTEEADRDVTAYAHLICTLCEMAKRQTRVLAVDKPVENEKYAFRCFLLRLGMIGTEYTDTRRILLKNLTGNGSMKGGERKAHEEKPPTTPQETEATPSRQGKFSLKKLFSGLKLLALE